MADDQVPVTDSPRQLLSATHELTRRVREAQRATWFPLLAISLALFVLAWAERNGALLAFAVCYLAATLLANYSDVPRRLFEDLGWVATPQWFFLPTLCLAGGVLLLGGAAFAVAERRRK